MEVAGREIKRVTLELGGSDPMIVMEDANIDLAMKMADVGRYFNCGQMCLGVKGLFFQESVADNFIGGLWRFLKKKTIGNGMSKETRIGPIHPNHNAKKSKNKSKTPKRAEQKLSSAASGPKAETSTRDSSICQR